MPLRAPEAYQYPAPSAVNARKLMMPVAGLRRSAHSGIYACKNLIAGSFDFDITVLDSNQTGLTFMQTSETISRTDPRIESLTARWPALLTICLGVFMVYVIGFSPFARAHNSAHDTRHANGFPCH
jgi:cobalt transporter subunit CbtB